MHRTNTTILFPDAGDPNIPSIRKGSVIISGSIHNVYLARQQLIGSLPLLMMFDLPDDVMIDDGCVQGLQEELDVSITIKPKSRQANKTVIIRTQERNGSAIYKARAVILGLDDEPVVKATIPECYNIQAVSTAATGMTQNSPPVPGTSPRNSSPVHNDTDTDNLSSNFEKLHLNSSSGSTSGIGTQSEKSSSFASGGGGGTVRIEQGGGASGAGTAFCGAG